MSDLLITKRYEPIGARFPYSQTRTVEVKRNRRGPQPAHNRNWCFCLLAALALVTCKGAGCLPGDYITTCRDACGANGVQVVLPTQNVCVCNRPVSP